MSDWPGLPKTEGIIAAFVCLGAMAASALVALGVWLPSPRLVAVIAIFALSLAAGNRALIGKIRTRP